MTTTTTRDDDAQKPPRIRPQRRNANRHTQRGMGMLEGSIERDGIIGALTVAADDEVFDGSARAETLPAMGFDLTDVAQVVKAEPGRVLIIESDGSSPLVHRRVDIPDADDPRAKRLGIAANRIGQLNLEWEPDVLAELAADADVDLGAYFFADELADLAQPIEVVPGGGGDDFDTTPDDGPTRAQLGDLWQIGPHRLLVGDCTDAANVARLMGGERAGAMASDSPYGIEQEGIINDDPQGLRALFDGALAVLPIDSGVIVNFQSTRLFPVWLDALRAAGQKFERMLWMYKAAQNTYPWRGWLLTSEAILVSTKGAAEWNDHHPYSHDCYYLSEVSGEIPEGMGWHASVKPMSVVTDIVQRISKRGGLVYDPFLGSGTTLIAAHRTGRRCYGCELSPRYADVILRRAEAEGLTVERVEAPHEAAVTP